MRLYNYEQPTRNLVWFAAKIGNPATQHIRYRWHQTIKNMREKPYHPSHTNTKAPRA